MAKPVAILSPESNKASHVAQGVLYVLAGVSLAGAVWALGVRSGNEARLTSPSLLPEPAPAASGGPVGQPNYPVNQATLAAPAPVVPAPMAPTAQRPSLPAGREIKLPLVLESLEAGRQARNQGDMQGSLEFIRQADLREPNHPEILSEMAMTYEAMGIMSKAESSWRSVAAMGEAGAGGYFALAKSKLAGGRPENPSPVASSPVSLGACQVIKDPSVTNGERIAVRVPLIATPGAVIDPAQMDIHVFLFQKVNGERVEQARAAAPTLNWVSAPVDWKSANEELVDVVYDLPPPKPNEVRDLGRRTFHGFVVKLFYQNKLAGEQAQPGDLLNFSSQPSAPAGLDNALFPK
ncbi:MAG: tetratricopeptide repeat protein [Verrucomicrobium sp.]